MKHKRVLSFILTVAMLLSLIPGAAFSVQAISTEESEQLTELIDESRKLHVIYANGTETELTPDELCEEAESHITDENEEITVEGIALTWGELKGVLAAVEFQSLLNESEELGLSVTDEEHIDSASNLLTALSTTSTDTIYLIKVSENIYKVDIANTGLTAYMYNLDDTTQYYISDDQVTVSGEAGSEVYSVTLETGDNVGTLFSGVSTVAMIMEDVSDKNEKEDEKQVITIRLTLERYNGDDWDASVSYSLYDSSVTGGNAVAKDSGIMTIPAGEFTVTKDIKFTYEDGSPEAQGLPGMVYLDYSPEDNCMLSTDSSSNFIHSASLLLGNGYTNYVRMRAAEYDNKTYTSGPNIINSVGANWAAFSYPWGSGIDATATSTGFSFKIDSPQIISRASSIDPGFFRVLLIQYASWTNCTSEGATLTLKDKNSKVVSETTYESNETDATSDWIKYDDTTTTVSLNYQLKGSGRFAAKSVGSNLNKYGCYEVFFEAAPKSEFSAIIPSGAFFDAGDVVPILVRNKSVIGTDADSTTIDINGVTCSNVLATYDTSAILFGWTVPEDFTGGKVTLTNLVSNNVDQNMGTIELNCNIDYSNKLGSFDLSKVEYTSIEGTASIKLPLREEEARREWIFSENELADSTTAKPYLKSMYLLGNDKNERIKLYAHKTGNEDIDYLYAAIPEGQISILQLYYHRGTNSDGTDFTDNTTAAQKNALFYDMHFNFPCICGASNEYETDTEDESKPADGLINIVYNDTWVRYANETDVDAGSRTNVISKINADYYEKHIDTGNEATTYGKLTLSYTAKDESESGKKYSFNMASCFSWESSNTEIATIENVEADGVQTGVISLTGATGTVSFKLTCSNGKHPVTLTSCSLTVSESPDAYLYIPTTSKDITTRRNMACTLRFSSNIPVRNALDATKMNTLVTLKVYDGTDTESTAVYSTSKTVEVTITEESGQRVAQLSTAANEIQIPENVLSKVGTYTAVLYVDYEGTGDGIGTGANCKKLDNVFRFTDSTVISVKPRPVELTMTLPSGGNYVVDTSDPSVSWVGSETGDSTQWKYEITGTDGAVVSSGSGTGEISGSYVFPKTPKTMLKEIYTVTVYATNNADEDGWSIASAAVYVYNGDALDILIHNSKHLEDGTPAECGDSAKLDNRTWLRSMLSTDGKSLNLEGNSISLAELQKDVNLSAVVSMNYGNYVWGNISDQISWNAEHDSEDAGILYYRQATQYVSLDTLELDSVLPTGEFIEQGLNDGTVKITATHARTGVTTSVNIDIDRVDDEFYLFQFYPKATTKVTYTDKLGNAQTVYSDSKGQLALLEENQIDVSTPIYVSSEYESENYVGMIEPGELKTGENDSIQYELYPVNVCTLRQPGKVTISLQYPDGRPVVGKNIIMRGGAYCDDVYSEKADIFLESGEGNIGDPNTSNGLNDITVTTDDTGSFTVYFNLEQVCNDERPEYHNIKYVFELRCDTAGCRPEIVKIDTSFSNTAVVKLTAAVDNLGKVHSPGAITPADQNVEYKRNNTDYSGSVKVESFANRVTMYRYTDGTLQKTDNLDMKSTAAKLGPNSQYDGAVVEYETILWDHPELIDANNSDGQPTELLVDSSECTQYYYSKDSNGKYTIIGNGDTTQTSSLWVYPFSSLPIVTTIVNLDAEGFGCNEDGTSTETTWIEQFETVDPTLLIKLNNTYKEMKFPFLFFNGIGMSSPSSSARAMSSVARTLESLQTDVTDYGIIELPGGGILNQGLKMINNSLTLLKYGVDVQFAATIDPNVYYVFMTPSGGADSISDMTDEILGWFGVDQDKKNTEILDDYLEDTSKYGINPTFDDLETMFDKYFADSGAGTTDFANYKVQSLYEAYKGGALLARAEFDSETKKWNLYYERGTMEMMTQLSYGYVGNFSILCFLVNVSLAPVAGFDNTYQAKINVDKNGVLRSDLLRSNKNAGGIEGFVGLGAMVFGIGVRAGVMGRSRTTVEKVKLTSRLHDGDSIEVVNDSYRKDITGSVSLQAKAGIGIMSATAELLIGHTQDTSKDANYDTLMNIFNGSLNLTTNENKAVITDDGYLAVNRTEIRLRERNNYSSLSPMSTENAFTNYGVNGDESGASEFVYSDDGEYVFYLDDMTASWADKDGNPKGKLIEVDEPENENNEVGDFGHFNLDASGSGDNLFAAWNTQTQNIKQEGNTGSLEDIGAILSSMEITVSTYDTVQKKWIAETITNNSAADMSPVIASKDNKAAVAWLSGNSSGSGTDALNFDIDSNIMFSFYDGSTWSEPVSAMNTVTIGTVTAMDVTMLGSDTALIAYTVQNDEGGTEIYYSIVKSDGTSKTSCVTSCKNTDCNIQVVGIDTDKGPEAVIAWYSNDGNQEQICLRGVYANGAIDEKITETISAENISSNFRMDGNSFDDLTVAWTYAGTVDEDNDFVDSHTIYGVRFFDNGEKIISTPTQVLVAPKSNVSVENFSIFVAGSKVSVIMEESDYSGEKYKTTDVTAADIVRREDYDSEEKYQSAVSDWNSEYPDGMTVKTPVAEWNVEKAESEFKDTISISEVICNTELVAVETDLPVFFKVQNDGFHKITSLSVNGKTIENTELNPGDSVTIACVASFGSTITDKTYTISANSAGNTFAPLEKTLTFNVPEIQITDVDTLEAGNGERELTIQLQNTNPQISLDGSGRTVKLDIYADEEYSVPVVDSLTVPEQEYALLDNSALTLCSTIDLLDVLEKKDLEGVDFPSSGIDVYIQASVLDGDGANAKLIYSSKETITFEPMSVDLENSPVSVTVDEFKQDNQNVKIDLTAANASLHTISGQNIMIRVMDQDENPIIFNYITKDLDVEETKEFEVELVVPEDTVVSYVVAECVDEIEAPDEPEIDGYTFDGWYDSSELADVISGDEIAGKTLLYLKWSKVEGGNGILKATMNGVRYNTENDYFYAFNGDIFSVDITVEGENFAGAEYYVQYNPESIQLMSYDAATGKYTAIEPATATEVKALNAQEALPEGFQSRETVTTNKTEYVRLNSNAVLAVKGKAGVTNGQLPAGTKIGTLYFKAKSDNAKIGNGSISLGGKIALTATEAAAQVDAVKCKSSFDKLVIAPLFDIELVSDYVSGKTLAVLYTESTDVRFAIDGNFLTEIEDNDTVKYTYGRTQAQLETIYAAGRQYLNSGVATNGHTYTYAIVADVTADNWSITKIYDSISFNRLGLDTGSTYPASVSLSGDDLYNVNGSTRVDLYDAVAAAGVYNVTEEMFSTSENMSSHMPIILKADVNRDGIVNMEDVSKILSNYTKK